MIGDRPRLYFRIRENGAMVFRVDPENRSMRLELQQIAVVNTRNGEIKPHGAQVPSEDELTEIRNWIEERRQTTAAREADVAWQTIESLNMTAGWAQQRADEKELERVTDALLLAMHDLRSVLVRKAADRLTDDDDQAVLR